MNLRYAYTADDERILEFDATAFQSVWRLRDLGGQVIREFRQNTATGAMSWQKDWIRRGTQPVAAVNATEGTRHLHPDHLGTTRAITDSVGTHRSTYHFDPYGELAASFTPGTETMHFTGHERDDHRLTGGGGGTTDDLDYMHARYYNPMVGRFLRVDPGASSLSGMGRSWNKYLYGLNKPLNLVDPDGEVPILPIILGVAAGVIFGAEPANTPMSAEDEMIQGSDGAKGMSAAAGGVFLGFTVRSFGVPGVPGGESPPASEPCMGPCGEDALGEPKGPRPEKKKFDRAQDAQDQFEEIEERQRKSRKGGADNFIIESMKKSEQREKNELRRINDLAEATEEFDETSPEGPE